MAPIEREVEPLYAFFPPFFFASIGIDIVAGIGAASGVIGADLFAAIVAMSILTTLVIPPVLRRLVEEPAT